MKWLLRVARRNGVKGRRWPAHLSARAFTPRTLGRKWLQNEEQSSTVGLFDSLSGLFGIQQPTFLRLISSYITYGPFSVDPFNIQDKILISIKMRFFDLYLFSRPATFEKDVFHVAICPIISALIALLLFSLFFFLFFFSLAESYQFTFFLYLFLFLSGGVVSRQFEAFIKLDRNVLKNLVILSAGQSIGLQMQIFWANFDQVS